jgi:hypothetical protein
MFFVRGTSVSFSHSASSDKYVAIQSFTIKIKKLIFLNNIMKCGSPGF